METVRPAHRPLASQAFGQTKTPMPLAHRFVRLQSARAFVSDSRTHSVFNDLSGDEINLTGLANCDYTTFRVPVNGSCAGRP